MKRLGIFSKVNTEADLIIVATINPKRISDLLDPDQVMLKKLIMKQD